MGPIDLTPSTITFAFLLTAAGVGIAGGIITGLVALVFVAFPPLALRVTGASLAFVLSAILFIFAGIAVHVDSLDAALVVFVAWLTCATAAVGVHQVTTGALRSGPR